LLETAPTGPMPTKAEMFDAFMGSGLRKTLTGERGAPRRKKDK